jgi:hypothetical protein
MKNFDNNKNEENEDINYSVRDLTIKEIIPNVIDNFLVSILENHHTLVIPSNVVGIQFKAWFNGRGGIFSKDVLNYSRDKKSSKYVLIQGNGLYCIARLISEEEKSLFETLKLIDGQIKDVSYMILRNLREDEQLTNTYKFIKEKDIYTEIDSTISIPITKPSPDEDQDYHSSSISLFND